MEFVEKFIDNAKKLNVNIDSIVVGQNKKIDEHIINNVKLHKLRSCSKLLVAMAYGIAINNKLKCKDGSFISLETNVYSTLKQLASNIPEQAKDWTIRTLLTHSTGYEKMLFREVTLKDVDKSKLLEILFNTPLKYVSNSHFTYSNAEPYLLSVFFKENFGIDIAEYINEKIFKPLEIKEYLWEKFGNYSAGATGLFLNYKDFHKIAQLFFNFGLYNGMQIVPKEWVTQMIEKQINCPEYFKPERLLPKLSAGYYTWLSRDGIIFRDGSDGQYIICDYVNDRLITIMSTEENMYLVTECLKGLL